MMSFHRSLHVSIVFKCMNLPYGVVYGSIAIYPQSYMMGYKCRFRLTIFNKICIRNPYCILMMNAIKIVMTSRK